MNTLEQLCKMLFIDQSLYLITLNGNESHIDYIDNKYIIQNMVTGDVIEVDKCENISIGFCMASFTYNNDGFDLMIGLLQSIEKILKDEAELA